MSTALATTGGEFSDVVEFMPAMTIGQAKERYEAMKQFVAGQLAEERDYGTIPGSTKPCLYKPGAEKLCTFFGLHIPLPKIVESVKDWTGKDHGGEPFFYYELAQELTRNGEVVAASYGSCSSWESKYRYRKAERVCPQCNKPAIIKGKKEYGGGWLCWKKKDGCGATFTDGDSEIESQQVGRLKNPDVCDQVNTIQKMAHKRAFIGAALLATNASEHFTQDIEDLHADDEPPVQTVTPKKPAKANGNHTKQEPPRRPHLPPALALAEELGWNSQRLTEYIRANYTASLYRELNPVQQDDLAAKLLAELDNVTDPRISDDQAIELDQLLAFNAITIDAAMDLLGVRNLGEIPARKFDEMKSRIEAEGQRQGIAVE